MRVLLSRVAAAPRRYGGEGMEAVWRRYGGGMEAVCGAEAVWRRMGREKYVDTVYYLYEN